MSATIRDLWPDDIKTEDVVTPQEILDRQAIALTDRTNGLLVGQVVRDQTSDRIILRFEVEAPKPRTRISLFRVEHRESFEYPAAIIPPAGKLPDYLKESVYRPSLMESMTSPLSTLQGKWITNEWLATSPKKFAEKIEELLSRADVKATVLSLLARAKAAPTNGNDATEPAA